jgi:hypothetical protein
VGAVVLRLTLDCFIQNTLSFAVASQIDERLSSTEDGRPSVRVDLQGCFKICERFLVAIKRAQTFGPHDVRAGVTWANAEDLVNGANRLLVPAK